MFDLTKSDGQIFINLRKKRKEKKKKKLFSLLNLILSVQEKIFIFILLFVFFYLIESGTHMSPFALLGLFQSRNNLFRPGFHSIYLKWKFFKYLTFFRIFFKIFVFWDPLDAHRLEFNENPIVSKFNEILLGN